MLGTVFCFLLVLDVERRSRQAARYLLSFFLDKVPFLDSEPPASALQENAPAMFGNVTWLPTAAEPSMLAMLVTCLRLRHG